VHRLPKPSKRGLTKKLRGLAEPFGIRAYQPQVPDFMLLNLLGFCSRAPAWALALL